MKKNQVPDVIMNQNEKTAMRIIKYLLCIIVLCTFFTKYSCYSGEKCNNFMTCEAKRLYEDNVDSVLVELKFTNYSNDTSYIEASIIGRRLVPDSLRVLYPKSKEIIDSLSDLGISVEPYDYYKSLNKFNSKAIISLNVSLDGLKLISYSIGKTLLIIDWITSIKIATF